MNLAGGYTFTFILHRRLTFNIGHYVRLIYIWSLFCVCMELHIDVYVNFSWRRHWSSHETSLKFAKLKCALMLTQNLKIYIKVSSELRSRDCPKCCFQSFCLQITLMFEGQIASKFCTNFHIENWRYRRLHCCLLSIILTLNCANSNNITMTFYTKLMWNFNFHVNLAK